MSQDEGFSQTRTSDSNASSLVRYSTATACQEHAVKLDRPTAVTVLPDTLCLNNPIYTFTDDQFPVQPPASPPLSAHAGNSFVPKPLFSNGTRQHTMARVSSAGRCTPTCDREPAPLAANDSAAKAYSTTHSFPRLHNSDKKNSVNSLQMLALAANNNNNNNSPCDNTSTLPSAPQTAFNESTVV